MRAVDAVSTSGARWALAGLLLVALVAGCARLPEHARPRGQIVRIDSRGATDTIRYRTLTRGDFRASAAPETVAEHARRMGATTCVEIVPDSPLKAAVQRDRKRAGFVARPVGIGYHATMNRRCSWWNEAHPVPKAYLLQHEQIHFAIIELAARALTARARALSATGDSPAASVEALGRAVRAELERTLEEALARNTAFDRDTSMRYRPDRQDRWQRQVEAELAEQAP